MAKFQTQRHLTHPYPQIYKVLLKSPGIYWPLLSTFLLSRLIEPYKSLRTWLIREVTCCQNQSLQRLRLSLSFHSDYVLIVHFLNTMLVRIWDHQSELYLGNFEYMCGLAWTILPLTPAALRSLTRIQGMGRNRNNKNKKNTHTDKWKHCCSLSQEIGLNF